MASQEKTVEDLKSLGGERAMRQELKAQIAKLEAEKQEMVAAYDRYQEEISRLEDQCESKETRINRLKRDNGDLKIENERLRALLKAKTDGLDDSMEEEEKKGGGSTDLNR